MSDEKFTNCRYCGEVCTRSKRGKTLCKSTASSILCNEKLLLANEKLKLVAEKDHNKYLRVADTNTVIMHVEKGFCILLDYEVEDWQNRKCILPKMLSTANYRVFQINGRDWVRHGSRKYIGNDIHKLVYGEHVVNLRRKQGLSLHHEAETSDERTKNTSFEVNPCEKTHQTRVYIRTAEELDDFIKDVIANEGKDDGIYFDKKRKRKKKCRHNVR